MRCIYNDMGEEAGGWGFSRTNPHPALRATLPIKWGGLKRRIFNDIEKEVTLPHLMGKGRGWGFPRQTSQQPTASAQAGNPVRRH